MDVSGMVLIALTGWVLLSGPAALLIGRVLRDRGDETAYPPVELPEQLSDESLDAELRELVSAGR